MLYLGTWSGICAVYLGTCCGAVLDSCSDAFLGEGRGCRNDWSDSHRSLTIYSQKGTPIPKSLSFITKR